MNVPQINVIPEAPSSQLPAQTEAGAVLHMIERAARDPSVDIDKLQRLMEMRKSVHMETAEQSFNRAMRATQAEMHPISADASNPQTRSKYATYAKLDRVLRPIYTKHGFSLSFDEADSPKPDHIRVLCYVSHDDGFTRTYRKDMPADGKGAKGGDVMTKTHAAGAASTYGSRYLLKGIFNVAVGEDDRDGNDPAEVGGPVTQEQLSELIALADDVGADKAAFCKYMGIDSFAALPAKSFARAVTALNRKRAK